jgi:cobalamin biosynthesis Mg chelatase CobN
LCQADTQAKLAGCVVAACTAIPLSDLTGLQAAGKCQCDAVSAGAGAAKPTGGAEESGSAAPSASGAEETASASASASGAEETASASASGTEAAPTESGAAPTESGAANASGTETGAAASASATGAASRVAAGGSLLFAAIAAVLAL